MGTSLVGSQLQKIRSAALIDTEPTKRPITRPSVLFDPKQAADYDLDYLLQLALSGLEILISKDERFSGYKNDLFSYKARELDRELMTEEQNKGIDSSIGSFLQLLSGFFNLPASLHTLEYLIRRYKIHVYNVEDLVLCVLPYHDTHAFVRIVQILDIRNGKWTFLEGVKKSGAPLPRNVLVQQSIRDMGVLETLCDYASPGKRFHPGKPVISFCTAVVIEVLGSLTSIDSDVVKRILPFVVAGIQPGNKAGLDHKAGALMIIGLLANKVALSPKLVKSLLRSLAELAREDSKEITDLQWLRLSVMALINLVQLQSVNELPKKALDLLNKTSDFAGILLELSKEFNIDRFLSVLLESLLHYSSSDAACHKALISILEIVPMKNFADHVVSKVLFSGMKMLERKTSEASSESGSWAKKILMVVNKHCPFELRQAVRRFLENSKVRSVKEGSALDVLSSMMEGSLNVPGSISDSKILFAMHHPRADVRLATLSRLNASGLLRDPDPQRRETIQDAVLHWLQDDDLAVVQAALSLEGLTEVIDSSAVLKALEGVLGRCVSVLMSGSSDKIAQACDIAVSFLSISPRSFDTIETKRLATMMFPLLLIFPKTQRLNLKVLELVREVKWPFYDGLADLTTKETKLNREKISSINMKIVDRLAEALSVDPEKHMPWLVESSSDTLSKTLFLLILMQSFARANNKGVQFGALFEACFPVLRIELETFELGNNVSVNQFNKEKLDLDSRCFLDQLFHADLKALNTNVIICAFWKLLEALISAAPVDLSDDNGRLFGSRLRDVFFLFATSRSKHVFKEQLHYIVTKCKIPPLDFLLGFFTGEEVPVVVQVESLHCLAFLCSNPDDVLLFQLLTNFPSLLVPLTHDSQDVRLSAMGCLEGLYAVSHRLNSLSKKNGNNASWISFLGELLGLIVQQKRLIVSNINFLPSYLMSLLGSSSTSLLAPSHVEQRFDQSTKEGIIGFIVGYALQLSALGKLSIVFMLKGLGNKLMRLKNVESLLLQLLTRRRQYYIEVDNSSEKLSKNEIKLLCLLLETCAMPTPPVERHGCEDYLLRALQVDRHSSEESAIIEPCVLVLQKLTDQIYNGLTTEKQELLFHELLFLFRDFRGDIQNAAREALQRINISCSTFVHTLNNTSGLEIRITGSTSGKKKKSKANASPKDLSDMSCKGESVLAVLSSVLDILVLKKDIIDREFLIGPLFDLLGKTFSERWVLVLDEKSCDIAQGVSSSLHYMQQTILLILEDTIRSLPDAAPLEDEIASKINVKMLVECAHHAKDSVTCNHIFSLLSVTAKVIPDKILEHLSEIFTVLGESTVNQIDSYSERVFEDFISSVAPHWLAKTDSIDEMLQIFVNVFPKVAEHRRLSIAVFLLRTLGDKNGLASLLALLFQSLVLRKGLSSLNDPLALDSLISSVRMDWEYAFAVQICDQYSCTIWLPSLVNLLKRIETGHWSRELFMVLIFLMEFILHKLQDPELKFKLDSDAIQRILQELMEHFVFVTQLVDARRKEVGVLVTMSKELKERMCAALGNITAVMVPSSYFKGMISLLGELDTNVKKKALGLLCETLKGHDILRTKHTESKRLKANLSSNWFHVDESSLESFEKMCLEIVRIVDNASEETDASLKLSAISAVEVLAKSFASDYSIFKKCLPAITRGISSSNLAISSSCLKTAGALVSVLGPRALAELPRIMENVIEKSQEISSCSNAMTSSDDNTTKESLMQSILVTLEAVLDKLGGFLNPYLESVMRLLVLGPKYPSESKLKLKNKSDQIRKLVTEKIPVRLALPSILKVYDDAAVSGDSSLVILFDMVASLISKMDRLSISGYHGQVFDFCLSALDLRRQNPGSIQHVEVVEKSIINAFIGLTRKLTETMFKPLFIRTIDWVESYGDDVSKKGSCMDRAISFYGLVNKLAENHRSLFVPYFKYLLDDCIRRLTDAKDTMNGTIRKKKKAKLQEVGSDVKEESSLHLKSWHLRAVVVSALHKCFLYDTGSRKFLESSTFEVLLKPIVSQLVVEPPPSLEEHPNLPSVSEVDESLVCCIGQMAVTAGSDLLWKPLNHEVLMQTRSEKVRTRILGVKVIRYLVEHLKEEYLVFLAETIPFFAELIEDVELPVKSLAQDIFKEMETLSGEDLRQYLR